MRELLSLERSCTVSSAKREWCFGREPRQGRKNALALIQRFGLTFPTLLDPEGKLAETYDPPEDAEQRMSWTRPVWCATSTLVLTAPPTWRGYRSRITTSKSVRSTLGRALRLLPARGGAAAIIDFYEQPKDRRSPSPAARRRRSGTESAKAPHADVGFGM